MPSRPNEKPAWAAHGPTAGGQGPAPGSGGMAVLGRRPAAQASHWRGPPAVNAVLPGSWSGSTALVKGWLGCVLHDVGHPVPARELGRGFRQVGRAVGLPVIPVDERPVL
jgi:hypothetical protein